MSDPGNSLDDHLRLFVQVLTLLSFRITFLIFHPLHIDTISKNLYIILVHFMISD